MTGLAGALIALVENITAPVLGLISVACWILAICAFLAGALRLIQHASQGRTPSGWGTLMWFMVAVVLVRLPEWVAAAGRSLFATAPSNAQVTLGYGAPTADWTQLIGAVLTIVSLIGLLAIIKGLFALRAAADGSGRETVPAASMNIIGGVCAWHIVPLLDAVQTTLGVTALRIG